jgi:hypothetical protein
MKPEWRRCILRCDDEFIRGTLCQDERTKGRRVLSEVCNVCGKMHV